MRIIRADSLPARTISHFASVGAEIAPIARPEAAAQVGLLRLAPGGSLGYHQATCRQLLVVVAGEGAVRAGEGAAEPVAAGDMVLWEAGEWHETTTHAGLIAMIVESDALDAR